jgi:hypothetical protein
MVDKMKKVKKLFTVDYDENFVLPLITLHSHAPTVPTEVKSKDVLEGKEKEKQEKMGKQEKQVKEAKQDNEEIIQEKEDK